MRSPARDETGLDQRGSSKDGEGGWILHVFWREHPLHLPRVSGGVEEPQQGCSLRRPWDIHTPEESFSIAGEGVGVQADWWQWQEKGTLLSQSLLCGTFCP